MIPKDTRFKAEQQQLKDTLLHILPTKPSDFNSEVLTFTSIELDVKKEAILTLLPKVQEYFVVRTRAFVYPDKAKRLHLSIIKELIKDKYKLVSTFALQDGKSIRKYHLYPVETKTT